GRDDCPHSIFFQDPQNVFLVVENKTEPRCLRIHQSHEKIRVNDKHQLRQFYFIKNLLKVHFSALFCLVKVKNKSFACFITS
ncbi:mCG1042598, partial [Mus musculus]